MTLTIPAHYQRRGLYRFLTDDGLDADPVSGNLQATGDYEGNPTLFYLAPSPGEVYAVQRLIVQISDSQGLRAERYGAIQRLDVGVRVAVYQGEPAPGVSSYLTTGPVRVHGSADWGRMGATVQFWDLGSGDNYVNIDWDFSKGGSPIFLDGYDGDALVVEVADDLTGLEEHTFFAHGRIMSQSA